MFSVTVHPDRIMVSKKKKKWSSVYLVLLQENTPVSVIRCVHRLEVSGLFHKEVDLQDSGGKNGFVTLFCS